MSDQFSPVVYLIKSVMCKLILTKKIFRSLNVYEIQVILPSHLTEDFFEEEKPSEKGCYSVGKPTSASVTPPIRLKTFTQGQIIITHQVSPIIIIGIDVCRKKPKKVFIRHNIGIKLGISRGICFCCS